MSKSEQVAKVTVTIKPDDETMKKIADFVKRHNCYSVDYIIDENIIGSSSSSFSVRSTSPFALILASPIMSSAF